MVDHRRTRLQFKQTDGHVTSQDPAKHLDEIRSDNYLDKTGLFQSNAQKMWAVSLSLSVPPALSLKLDCV